MSGIILNITNVSVAKMASETASHMYNVTLNVQLEAHFAVAINTEFSYWMYLRLSFNCSAVTGS